jgi:hypothetical protein
VAVDQFIQTEAIVTNDSFRSLTIKPPLTILDSAIRAARRGMNHAAPPDFAQTDRSSDRDAPGLVSKRISLTDTNKTISYDHFLFLIKTSALKNNFLRKKHFLNAKSDLEFFLIETGIYNKNTGAIWLDDGWFEQISIVASRHEVDPAAREELLTDSIKRNRLDLLDADNPKPFIISPTISADSEPREDDAIDSTPLARGSSHDWDRRPPGSSATARAATFNINLIARERANISHHMLERALATIAKKMGHAPKYNQNVDVFFDTPGETIFLRSKVAPRTISTRRRERGLASSSSTGTFTEIC